MRCVITAAVLMCTQVSGGAQPTITGLAVDHISHSSARVHWISSPASNRQVTFDTKVYWTANHIYRYKTPRWNPYLTDQYASISGLTPATTYVACPLVEDASHSAVVCDEAGPQVEFTTSAEPSLHPALPAAPDLSGLDTAYPAVDATLAVASNCSDLQAKITAAAGAAHANQTVKVVIPAGTTCQLTAGNNYALPPKTGTGWVIIQSSGTLPSAGTRIDPSDDAQLATISNPNGQSLTGLFDWTGGGGAAHHYRFVGIKFTHPAIAHTNDVHADSMAYLIRADAAIHHIILDRCWLHGRGYPDRMGYGWFGDHNSYVAFIDNYIDNVSIWRAYQVGNTVTHTTAATNTYTGGHAYLGNLDVTVGPFSVELSGSGSGHFRLYVTRAGVVHFVHDVASGLTAACTGCTSSYDASLAVPDDAFKLMAIEDSGNTAITKAEFKTAGGAATGNPWSIQDGSDTYLWEGATAFYMVDVDHILVRNNYVGATGLGFYVENWLGTSPSQDIELTGNTFQSDPNLFVHKPGDSNRMGYRRQHVEFKQGLRVLVEGNRFLDAWGGVPGVASAAVFIAPAGDTAHPQMGISDVTIRSNWIEKHPACFWVNGTGINNAQLRLLQNLLIENNVCAADAYARTPWYLVDSPWDGTVKGPQIQLIMGGEDYTIRHNTFYGGLGYQPYLLKLTDLWYEGLTVQDNIFFLQQSPNPVFGVGLGSRVDYADTTGVPAITSSEGAAALSVAAIRVPSTLSFTFDHNVIVTGCSSTDSCTESTSGSGLLNVATKSALYPAGNYWPTGDTYGGRIVAVGFKNPASGDYRLVPQSPYKGGDGSPASDNRDVGALYSELESKINEVKNISVVDVGQDAVVLRYTPPDGRACVVEYGISAEPGIVIRADDRGGTRQRQVVLSGLVADTQYSYAILCAAQRPGGSFRTRPASGDLVSVPVYLVPPTGIPVSEALAEYGPTEALGSTSEPVVCAGGCTIEVPAGAGRAVYRRVIYRDANHSMLARGAVEATIAH